MPSLRTKQLVLFRSPYLLLVKGAASKGLWYGRQGSKVSLLSYEGMGFLKLRL